MDKSTLLRVALMCLAVSGCKTGKHFHSVDDHAANPPGAIPAPLGTYSCEWQTAQASRAEQDYFVIYSNEWRYGRNENGTRLGPFGERHVEELASRLPFEPYTVVIDKSEDANLDVARRTSVVSHLQGLGIEDAESRVVIGRGEANGLYGLEAPQIGTGFIGGGGGVGGNSSGRGFSGGNAGGGFGGGVGGGGGAGNFGGGGFF